VRGVEARGDKPKKTTCRYSERDEVKRAEFDAELAKIAPETPIIYLDESGFDQFYQNERGWAKRGEKVFADKPGRKFSRTSLVAGQCGRNGEIIAPMPFDGTMNARLFNGWFANMLCHQLQNGSVVIMDNARFHSKPTFLKIAEVKGIRLLFLPPYSPDKNPIEHLWTNIKRFLRKNISRFKNLLSAIYNHIISN
jgi:transposase